MANPRARITAETSPDVIAGRLRLAADYIEDGSSPAGMSQADMLDVLEAIADVIAAAAPHGPIRERRQALYKALLDADVKREEIARAAAVSVPAIGFSIGSERRAQNSGGSKSKAPGSKKRRPRPS